MYNTTKPYKERILELIMQTWETPYVSVKNDIYPIIKKKFSYPEIDHTDGIGTKGIYHWQRRTFKNASIDALAMNLNDLALARAIPYKLQNHIIIPEDDNKAILETVESLVEECMKRKIAISGGETSIHNNITGMDISINVSGFIKEYRENKFQEGDALIGIRSNGLHSNGFTKVREIFRDEYREEFIQPTRIYLEDILDLDKRCSIHGMMHITGGAYSKLKGISNNVDVIITRNHKLKPQEIFEEIYSKGISDEEMYKTFNCGVGFILSVPKEETKIITEMLDFDVVGEAVAGKGRIVIESMFSEGEVEF